MTDSTRNGTMPPATPRMLTSGRLARRFAMVSLMLGVLIAIPGTLGYMAAGWGRAGLPADAIGFVSLATFALTIPTSILTTRFGVALAHGLSRRRLETAFGLFLAAVCLRFIWAILRG